MRKPKETETNLDTLYSLARKQLVGIDVEIREHPIAAESKGKVKELIGYNPVGDKQVLFKKGKRTISCVRGYVSFGYFEILDFDSNNTERFDTEQEVIDRVTELTEDKNER